MSHQGGWDVVGFNDLASMETDGGRRVKKRDYLAAGALPVVDQGDGLVGGYSDDLSLAYQGVLPVIVFGDHTRRFKFVDFPFAVGADGVKLLRPSGGVEPKYLLWALRAVDIPDRGYGRHFALLKKLRLPRPSFPEQRRIVETIEEQFSRLDAAEDSLISARARLVRFRASSLADAFAGDHEVLPLSEVAVTQLGKMLSQKAAKGGPDGRPYLRNKNVQWARFDLSDIATMDFSDAEAAKFRLQPGDVLVCEGGEVGRSAIWRGELDECFFQKALHRVRPSERLLSEFLTFYLRRLADTNGFSRFVTGSTIDHLPQEDLRQIPIPIPAIHEQAEIVALIEQQMSLAAAIDEGIAVSIRRASLLRRAVLREAFAGRLLSQTPSLDLGEKVGA